MDKRKKIIIGSIVAVLLLFAGLHFFISYKIRNEIDKAGASQGMIYKDLDLRLLRRSLALDSLFFEKDEQKIAVERISVEGFSIFDYLFKKNIHISKIKISQPDVALQTQKDEDEESDKEKSDFEHTLLIDEISLEGGKLKLLEGEETKLELEDLRVFFSDLKSDTTLREEKIPFSFKDYQLRSGKLSYEMSKLQRMAIDSLNIHNDQGNIHRLHITPKYTRSEYIQVIPHEMDLMDVSMEEISLEGLDWNFDSESFYFHSDKLMLDSIVASIYRDKTIADDPTVKKLYSRMIRELDFVLDIDTLQIKNSELTYEEVQENTGRTGKVFFKNMNATGKSITNKQMDSEDFPQSVIEIQSQFMGVAPLDVQWFFYVNNPSDHFRIRGKGTDIPVPALNSFFEPAFNMRAEEGHIGKMEFDFNGNAKTAQGDYEMAYKDLKLQVLKKGDSRDENKVLGFLANLFTHDKVATDEKAVEVKDIERDPTKSFWNYFWQCINDGLKQTIII